MIEALLTLIGLGLGAALGYWLGLLRGRGALAGQAAALEASLAETRAQLARRDEELAGIRIALENERVQSAKLSERVEAAKESFAEQRRQIDQMQEKVRETFAALSAAALKSNNEQFVTLAEAKMKPLREQLERYEAHIKELEKARAEAYGGLSKHLATLEARSESLTRETGQLVAALRQSGAKGKWGEATLQRIVELCGLSEHCDFFTQASQDGGGRPDLVVHLPGERMLAIDAKVNTSAYLDAAGAADEAERKRLLSKYATEVRGTLRALSAKEYWKQFSPAPEFVVMFMPGEAFFAAALSEDRDLLTDGVEKNVLLASPTTLIALLLAVRHGWQQQQVAENAKRIAAAGRDLYDRLCVFVKHLDDIRAGIEKAAAAYNNAVSSWESRTLPGVRRLSELGAETGKRLESLQGIDTPLRRAIISEADEPPSPAARQAS